jgi:hypothetical protein
MTRRLLILLTALSLLVCLAVVALWWSGKICYFGHRPQWSITAEWGTLSIVRDNAGWVDVAVHWVLLPGLALPAAVVMRGRLRRWRERNRLARPGYCVACGYNLTANVSGVCPECGKPRGDL